MFHVVIEKANGDKQVNAKACSSLGEAITWIGHRIEAFEKSAKDKEATYMVYDNHLEEFSVILDPDGDWQETKWKIIEML